VQAVALIPGDGSIVPDVTDSLKEIVDVLDVDCDWEIAEAGKTVMTRKAHP
jgi:isocitrate dehydrogenase (NAD+)